MKERLQKIIARAGFASRREAESLIDEGRVRVNGKLVTEQGFQADAREDHIKVDGKLLQLSNEFIYFLLNKPKGVVTTVSDPEGRTTIIDIMTSIKERLFPVGRLDMNTEGAILLTNDGELANKLLRPSAKCPKTYLVKVAGVPDAKDLGRLQNGITVDGVRYSRCHIEIIKKSNNSWLTVVLREGKNHQIKNMFEAVGHPVSKLRRIGFAFLSLKGLEVGQFRELNEVEVERLKRGDVEPIQPITPYRTLKNIGVEVDDDPKKKKHTGSERYRSSRKPSSDRHNDRGSAPRRSDSRGSDSRRSDSRGSDSRRSAPRRSDSRSSTPRDSESRRGESESRHSESRHSGKRSFDHRRKDEEPGKRRSSRRLDDTRDSGSDSDSRDSRQSKQGENKDKKWNDRGKKSSWKGGKDSDSRGQRTGKRPSQKGKTSQVRKSHGRKS